jgi:hypothetical protein
MLGIDRKIAVRASEAPPGVVSGDETPIFGRLSRDVRHRRRAFPLGCLAAAESEIAGGRTLRFRCWKTYVSPFPGR